jgi:hypothetical protein
MFRLWRRPGANRPVWCAPAACLLLGVSVWTAATSWKGHPSVFPDSSEISVDDLPCRAHAVARFVVRNSGPRAVRVLGAEGYCSTTGCIYLSTDNSVRIDPNNLTTVDFDVSAPPEPGAFVLPTVLYTNDPRNRRIKLRVVGRAYLP